LALKIARQLVFLTIYLGAQKKHMDWKTPGFAICSFLLVSACSDSTVSTTGSGNVQNDATGSITLAIPELLTTARAVNLDALYADVIINGDTQRWNQSTPIAIALDLAVGEMLNVTVNWYETLDSTPLPLTTWSLNQQITGDVNISAPASAYTSTGAAFDFDSDGFSNLAELRANSNPLVAGDTPENRPDVEIRWINPTEAPAIDGLYDSIWDRAQFSDVSGEQLSIDNLMINQGAVRPDGNTEFRWFAMHDDTSLYIFVLGENVDTGTPIRDSTSVWQDDNLNLFIDGNNSKLPDYDGVDDRHIFIPLLTSPTDPSSNSSVFVAGDNSAPVPDFEFATCLCSAGQHTWEIKLPLAALNIGKNVPFGFDIQIDEDNDGGARDARWAWFHPSRTTVDVDNTWTTPSFMGTAVIQ